MGGEKDEDPPVILESTPDNFSTDFQGLDFEFVFDEYFELRNLKQKLLISPPMEEEPEIKVRGKKLLIHFNSPLLPDRTYTLNFGDALVDRNEANPYENFQVVFSTGDEIDSLELYGKVVDAFTGEPAEGVSVMLYAKDKAEKQPLGFARGPGRKAESIDSLPLTTLPLYVSSTDEEGRYHLQNLAEGYYQIFALLDGNNNYLFDLPTESIAFCDTLVHGQARAKVEPDETPTEELSRDSVKNDELSKEAYKEDSLSTLAKGDIGGYVNDSTNLQPATCNLQPDSLYLYLFKESYLNQYISGTERKRADKVQINFNHPLDTLDLELLQAEKTYENFLIELSASKDTLICWITDSLISGEDSLFFALGYTAFDSLEQKTWENDTLRFNFKHQSAKQDDKNPMSLAASVGRTMVPGTPMRLTTGLPYKRIDSSRISLFRIRDSLEIPESFVMKTIETSTSLPGLNHIAKAHRHAAVDKVFLQDSSYSLRILPGAFTGYFGDTNDSLDINFKVDNEDKYGILVMNIDSLNEPAILQLLDSKENPIYERHISESTTERFTMLDPGQYSFKLILDKNNNGEWDTGRYLKSIQPEPIIIYNKEISLKAKWEMEESWIININ